MPQPQRIRLLLLGDEGCGKTCLIRRYVEGCFTPRYVPTVGVDFGVRAVPRPSPHPPVKANIYDLSGAPEYALVRSEFYREAQALLLVVDVTQVGCLERAAAWLEEAARGGLRAGVPVLLCVTKAVGGTSLGGGGSASPRAVNAAAARAWALARLGDAGSYFEASALTGAGVAGALEGAVEAAVAAAGGASGNGNETHSTQASAASTAR